MVVVDRRETGFVGAPCVLVANGYSSCISSDTWKNGGASFDFRLYLPMKKKGALMLECSRIHVVGNPVLVEVTDVVVYQTYTSRHRVLCEASTCR